MSVPTSPVQATSPYPDTHSMHTNIMTTTSNTHSAPFSRSASTVSSSSESDTHSASSRTTRADRPRIGDRQRSTSIIISKDADPYQREKPDYPPDDARAMSPRRNSRDLARLEKNARKSLKDQARTLQSSLAALAERIDEVKSDHDKLETENKFLQDYIGGLTKTMSRDGIGPNKKNKK